WAGPDVELVSPTLITESRGGGGGATRCPPGRIGWLGGRGLGPGVAAWWCVVRERGSRYGCGPARHGRGATDDRGRGAGRGSGEGDRRGARDTAGAAAGADQGGAAGHPAQARQAGLPRPAGRAQAKEGEEGQEEEGPRRRGGRGCAGQPRGHAAGHRGAAPRTRGAAQACAFEATQARFREAAVPAGGAPPGRQGACRRPRHPTSGARTTGDAATVDPASAATPAGQATAGQATAGQAAAASAARSARTTAP